MLFACVPTAVQIDVLCASNSLQLLFTNVLRKPLRIEVENKLRGFLETLLSKDAPAASPVLPIIKSAVSIAVAELRSAVPQFLELATGAESVK